MQLNCLATDWRRMRSAEDQISALRGLALAEVAFGISQEKIAALLDLIMPKLDSVILADGGHISRMPDRNLTLMRQLVELHGGKIWVESEMGKGSHFIFYVPCKGPEILSV